MPRAYVALIILISRSFNNQLIDSSIETTLLKVQNDILQILNRRKGAELLLLDLSAAFDTIDHSILLETLRHGVGITECLKTVSQVDRMLPARQRTYCFHVRTSFSKKTIEMWGPSGLSFRTSFVLHLYNSTRPYHQKTWHILPPLCR